MNEVIANEETEERLRESVIRVAQELVNRRLVVGTQGNVSARLDSSSFLLTPSGMAYHGLMPEDLVVVDLAGNVVIGRRKPSIELELHRLIYSTRSDVGGVVHAHSTYATAIAITRQPLPAVTDTLAVRNRGPVNVASYAPSGTKELARNAVTALGDARCVLLANHGILSTGRTVEDALALLEVVEQVAQMYVSSHSVGVPKPLEPGDIKRLLNDLPSRYGQ